MRGRMNDMDLGRPLLDIASYARRGPGRTDRLSPAEVAQIARTVGRTPEVMVKVLSKGGQSAGAVQRHFDYIGRGGELEIETDDGEKLKGKGVERALLEDWDLDLDAHRRQSSLTAANGRTPPKLVHKLVFSMPAGTPPDKVLAATRTFAREQFGMKHRYAMALHTDEPHPHVHLVLKAVSEQGTRLNIRKAKLQEWRNDFARYLREEGVSANATNRSVRGQSSTRKRDGIYRATLRGSSTHTRGRVEAVADELRLGVLHVEHGKNKLIQTRRDVQRGWLAVRELLTREGQANLAIRVQRFVEDMAPVVTEKERLAGEILKQPSMPTKVRPTDLTR